MYYDYSNYGTSNLGSAYEDALFGGIFGGIMIFYYLFLLAISVVQIIAMWKVFEKAGKPGWAALIPFYNTYTLFEISGYPGLYVLFILIPCFGPIVLYVFEILAFISLSKKFNKSSAFAVLLILVSVVGFCILGFGNDEYDPSLGEQKNSQPIDPKPTSDKKEETKTTKKDDSKKFCGNCGTKVSASANVCPNCGNKLK